ncbi:hypothetical protein AAMO2058_000064400 [Amorphochlora amoebiformis]
MQTWPCNVAVSVTGSVPTPPTPGTPPFAPATTALAAVLLPFILLSFCPDTRNLRAPQGCESRKRERLPSRICVGIPRIGGCNLSGLSYFCVRREDETVRKEMHQYFCTKTLKGQCRTGEAINERCMQKIWGGLHRIVITHPCAGLRGNGSSHLSIGGQGHQRQSYSTQNDRQDERWGTPSGGHQRAMPHRVGPVHFGVHNVTNGYITLGSDKYTEELFKIALRLLNGCNLLWATPISHLSYDRTASPEVPLLPINLHFFTHPIRTEISSGEIERSKGGKTWKVSYVTIRLVTRLNASIVTFL